MVTSVRESASDVVTTTVAIDGSTIPGEYMVYSIDVVSELNRIPRATVLIADGDPASETFAASEDVLFAPGREIRIDLGYHARNKMVFSGIITRHGLRLDAAGNSFLVLHCTDKAVALTIARSSRTFLNTTDSAAMSEIIESAGLTAEIEATTGAHEHVVQSQASDWDYLIARAEANGRVVLASGGSIKITKPQFDSPDYSVTFGESVLELDIDMDAANQLASVKAASWDPQQQQVSDGSATEPSINDQGDLSGARLAEVLDIADYELQTASPLGTAELADWADAQLLKSRLSRIRGTIRFPGNAGIEPGQLLEIQGLGSHFNGQGYVAGLRHLAEGGAWSTEASFGLERKWFTDVHRDSNAPPAASLTPGIDGLQIAKVLQVHNDPESAQRIKVSLPLISPETGIWVRMASPYAGDHMAMTFRPEVGDEVVIGFLNNDPNAAIVLGALQSSARPSPTVADEDNSKKAIVTRSQLTIEFDDTNKALTLKTPGGQVVTMSDEDRSIVITDQSHNTVTMTESGIDVSTPKDFSIRAGGSVTVRGDRGVSIESAAGVKIDDGDDPTGDRPGPR